jgi:hypothetical protein
MEDAFTSQTLFRRDESIAYPPVTLMPLITRQRELGPAVKQAAARWGVPPEFVVIGSRVQIWSSLPLRDQEASA